MKFKIFLLTFIYVLFIINGTSAKFKVSFGKSFGRSSSRGTSLGRTTHTYGGTSRTSFGSTSYKATSSGLSSSKPSTSRTSGHKPFGSDTSIGGSSVMHSTGKSPGSTTTQQHKNINTQFLDNESRRATQPNSYPAVPATSSIGGKSRVVTESKQTSAYTPQNQGHSPGQANPPWSNPYLGANAPITPSQTAPWANPYLGANRPPVSNSQPTAFGSHQTPIGFKDHVYPQTHPISPGTQFNSPTTGHLPYSVSGHPPYPVNGHPHYPVSGHPPYPVSGHPTYPGSGYSPYSTNGHSPLSNSWSGPSASPPYHQMNSMPLGNPYSIHAPGSAYGASGQPYYPQQTHMIAQPAVQPFIPGQTILMVPGQQDSGRGLGQMVKEALVFSTINAGVNRIINPHTHHHYSTVESRPDSTAAPTTHITYNNQYFNTAPGVNGTVDPTNVPQGNGSPNYPNAAFTPNTSPNVGGDTPFLGNRNSNIPNIDSTPSSSSIGNGIRTSNIESGRQENVITSTTGSNVASNQNHQYINPNIVDKPFYRISDDELFKISESLFAKNTLDMAKYIKLNLQTRVNSTNITDEAKEPLFSVEPELLEYPSIHVIQSLYDNYENDFRKKINRTLETRKKENLFIDIILDSNEMTTAMQWLANQGFIAPDDDFEKKDVLRRIWFTIFSGSTCGFERVFASENYGTAIIGVQDWIYFENQESLKRIDYMGYVDKLDLGSTASLLKLNFQMDGIIRPNATIFVGTLPELEMSLYTICFYARPNNLCPVSLGGTKFNIYTHSFIHFGNEVLDLGLPMF